MIHSLQNGKFAIHKILGSGGFGITYEATNTLIDKRMAIKEFFMADICMRGDDDTTVVVTSDTKRDLDNHQVLFVGICNPDALNIRIFNPQIALKMLIFNAGGLQIHLNVRIAEE